MKGKGKIVWYYWWYEWKKQFGTGGGMKGKQFGTIGGMNGKNSLVLLAV